MTDDGILLGQVPGLDGRPGPEYEPPYLQTMTYGGDIVLFDEPGQQGAWIEYNGVQPEVLL